MLEEVRKAQIEYGMLPGAGWGFKGYDNASWATTRPGL